MSRKKRKKITSNPLTVFPADGELFEFFVEALLEELGFRVLIRPARGPDGGRDIVAEQTYKDRLGTEHRERILVQCKHNAHSGRAVASVGDFTEALIRHSCHRYLLVTSTSVTENLRRTFEAFTNNARSASERADYWACADIMRVVHDKPRLRSLFFLPPAYRLALPPQQTIEALLESQECGSVIVNRKHKIVSLNERFKELFPGSQEGQRCWANYHSHQRYACPMCISQSAFDTGEEMHAIASSSIGPKKTPRWVEIRSFPIRDIDRSVVAVLETVRDVHERVVLDEFIRDIAGCQQPEEILRTVLLRISELLAVERCAVFRLAERKRLEPLAVFRLDMGAVRKAAEHAGVAVIGNTHEPLDRKLSLPSLYRKDQVALLLSSDELMGARLPPASSGKFPLVVTHETRPMERLPVLWRELKHRTAICLGREKSCGYVFLFANNQPLEVGRPSVWAFISRVLEVCSLRLLRLGSEGARRRRLALTDGRSDEMHGKTTPNNGLNRTVDPCKRGSTSG